MLLVIGNFRFANEIRMDCVFHTRKTSIQKIIMIYSILEFRIPDT